MAHAIFSVGPLKNDLVGLSKHTAVTNMCSIEAVLIAQV